MGPQALIHNPKAFKCLVIHQKTIPFRDLPLGEQWQDVLLINTEPTHVLLFWNFHSPGSTLMSQSSRWVQCLQNRIATDARHTVIAKLVNQQLFVSVQVWSTQFILFTHLKSFRGDCWFTFFVPTNTGDFLTVAQIHALFIKKRFDPSFSMLDQVGSYIEIGRGARAETLSLVESLPHPVLNCFTSRM